MAFTYNDPVIFAEYAMDVADACHARGIKTVAVTAGYMHDQPRREFYAKMDAANVDLKAFTEEFYFKLTGSHLQPVLDTLVYLKHETDVWFEITTLLIPTKNDSDEEITAMCRWIVEGARHRRAAALHRLSPGLQDGPTCRATPASTLRRAREIALREGLQYVYTGNVHDKEGGTTYLHRLRRDTDRARLAPDPDYKVIDFDGAYLRLGVRATRRSRTVGRARFEAVPAASTDAVACPVRAVDLPDRCEAAALLLAALRLPRLPAPRSLQAAMTSSSRPGGTRGRTARPRRS